MENKLYDMAKYAYTKVPFYIRLAEEMNFNIQDFDSDFNWDELPIVDKNMIVQSNSSIISVEYLPYLIQEKLIIAKTSGSTGKCMELYWHEKDLKKSLLPLWILRKKYYGINPNDKLCYFYTIRALGNMEKDIEYSENAIAFSKSGLNKDKLRQIYETILEYNPKWMLLQPSIAQLLVQCMKENNYPRINSLKYIELSGEMLFPELRKELQDAFGCEIANQYGCNEVNSIAYECRKGSLHCMSSNVFAEVLIDGKPAKDGEEGDIYITSLNNHAMPIIRYGIGDRGIKYSNKKCDCGNRSPIIELTTGRSNDWVYCKDENKVNSYVFVRAIEAINYSMDNVVRQFQVIQNDYDEFTVKLVLDDDELFQTKMIEKIFHENLIEPSIKNAKYQFEYQDTLLPDQKSGKLLYFRNNIIYR